VDLVAVRVFVAEITGCVAGRIHGVINVVVVDRKLRVNRVIVVANVFAQVSVARYLVSRFATAKKTG
jgi:hypothetical protein